MGGSGWSLQALKTALWCSLFCFWICRPLSYRACLGCVYFVLKSHISCNCVLLESSFVSLLNFALLYQFLKEEETGRTSCRIHCGSIKKEKLFYVLFCFQKCCLSVLLFPNFCAYIFTTITQSRIINGQLGVHFHVCVQKSEFLVFFQHELFSNIYKQFSLLVLAPISSMKLFCNFLIP